MGERFLIDRILERGSLSVHFQPVLDVRPPHPRPDYLEALIRGPRGTIAESPTILFEYARKKNKEALVDRTCVEAILDAALRVPADVRIGINVHASSLAMDAGFIDFLGSSLEARGISPLRLVVEIVEHAPPWDVAAFRNALDGLRCIGARIALDDIGLGHSNFLMILECRPEYFKIDRYFVHGAVSDFYRQAVLSSVAQLARPFGARVVAEGVETEADLVAVRAAGIDLVQGWLFGGARSADGLRTGRDGCPDVR